MTPVFHTFIRSVVHIFDELFCFEHFRSTEPLRLRRRPSFCILKWPLGRFYASFKWKEFVSCGHVVRKPFLLAFFKMFSACFGSNSFCAQVFVNPNSFVLIESFEMIFGKIDCRMRRNFGESLSLRVIFLDLFETSPYMKSPVQNPSLSGKVGYLHCGD